MVERSEVTEVVVVVNWCWRGRGGGGSGGGSGVEVSEVVPVVFGAALRRRRWCRGGGRSRPRCRSGIKFPKVAEFVVVFGFVHVRSYLGILVGIGCGRHRYRGQRRKSKVPEL